MKSDGWIKSITMKSINWQFLRVGTGGAAGMGILTRISLYLYKILSTHFIPCSNSYSGYLFHRELNPQVLLCADLQNTSFLFVWAATALDPCLDSQVHQYLFANSARLTLMEGRSFSAVTRKLWNAIPQDLHECTSFSHFQSLLLLFLCPQHFFLPSSN